MKFDAKYKKLSEKEKRKYDKAFLNEDRDLTKGASNKISIFYLLTKNWICLFIYKLDIASL